jgi:dsRNA-specific ribonuclease
MAAPLYASKAQRADFREFINDLLLRMGLKEADLTLIFNKDHGNENYGEFAKCFITKNADPVYNYEVYELAGDGCINNAIIMYLFHKINSAQEGRRARDAARGMVFKPNANVTDYFNKLKAMYISSKEFHDIAVRLGFDDYVEFGSAATRNPHDHRANADPDKILADSLEAFIGCFEVLGDRYLKHHYSHHYVSNFVNYIMNSRKVNYHPDYIYMDAITLLKETNDAFRFYSNPPYQYVLENNGKYTNLFFKVPGKNKGLIAAAGQNVGAAKGNVEMSMNALRYLDDRSKGRIHVDPTSPDYGYTINPAHIKLNKIPTVEDLGIEDLM